MKDTFTKQQIQEIVKALDEAIADGPWDSSNFLKAIGKKLGDVREKLISYLQEQGIDSEALTFKAMNKMVLRANQQEVYVSVYSADGRVLSTWERILANLPRQIISRPIYAEEADVQAALKHKENKENEGYVVIYINASDILTLPEDKTPKDKFGKSLLTLKDKAIRLEDVVKFVHISGSYNYQNGRLTRVS
jgi:intracellular multiplication protein IcmQ